MKKGSFRRFTAFALCGTMTVVSLAGCGGSASSNAEITSEADALAAYQDSGVVMDISE